MKIGLITFHDTTNFGSLLQTYGLYKKIEELGFEIDVIDYKCESIIRREVPRPFNLWQHPKKLLKDILFERIKRKKYASLSTFLNSHMTLSQSCDKETIHNLSPNYNKFIIGSDIVWGMDIIEEDLTFFLNFEQNSSKKTAFASSIGNPWSEKDKKLIKPLLNDFNYIAVREEESANWVEELTNNRPDVVCDPTMLLSSDKWLQHTYKRKDNGKYVLVYFDNNNGDCLNAAKRFAQNEGLSVKFINYGIPRKGVKNIQPISLEDFLSLISNAAKIVTASYHGLLFSIYFNKPFVYFNRAHKSRMNTLAHKLKVTNCDGQGKDILNMPDIDYNLVNKAVEKYRQESICCLKKLLQK